MTMRRTTIPTRIMSGRMNIVHAGRGSDNVNCLPIEDPLTCSDAETPPKLPFTVRIPTEKLPGRLALSNSEKTTKLAKPFLSVIPLGVVPDKPPIVTTEPVSGFPK